MKSENRTIRIFVSSPKDVDDERQKAKKAIHSLQDSYYKQATLDPVLWEDKTLSSNQDFQSGIDQLVTGEHRVDIAVFILWSRLGSPLREAFQDEEGNQFRSGTEYEFYLMLKAFEKSGNKTPIILAYTRKDDDTFFSLLQKENLSQEQQNERWEQKNMAEQFVESHFHDHEGRNLHAYYAYGKPVEFAERLDNDLRTAIDQLLGVHDPAKVWTSAPYRSLEAFDIAHSPIFYGRSAEIEELRQKFFRQDEAGCSFVCVIGASGSGKSSLAKAGLAGTLKTKAHTDEAKEWRAVTFLPGSQDGEMSIFARFANELAAELPALSEGVGGLDRLVSRLATNPEAASDLVAGALERAASEAHGRIRLLIVLDQMEELWTDRNLSPEDREAFLESVEAIAGIDDVSIVATLRSDYYAEAQASDSFCRMKGEHGHFDLRPPKSVALQDIISEPARRAGIQFEVDSDRKKRLDEVILEDVLRENTPLPLLQFTLDELYNARDRERNLLTYAAYQDLGGVESALERRLEAVHATLPDGAIEALDAMFPLLVTVDPDGDQNASRRRARLDELRGLSNPGEAAIRTEIVDALIDARFLVSEVKDGVPVAGLTHESLLKKWPQLNQWVLDNRDMLRLRAQTEQSEQRWERADRDASLLLTPGVPLQEGSRLLIAAPELLEETTREFLRLSIARALKEAIRTGNRVVDRSTKTRTDFPEIWEQVVGECLADSDADLRKNAADLLQARGDRIFEKEMVDLLVHDSSEAVRKACAYALVERGNESAYDRVLEEIENGERSSAMRFGPLAGLLSASEMQPEKPKFADWYRRQKRESRLPARLLSYGLRFRSAIPVFLIILIPACAFAVLGAAIVKWAPSYFNYSCVQATASLPMGLFHSAPAGIFVGGGIVFGLTLYRMVVGREWADTSGFRPYPAILFGAVFGLLAGLFCVAVIALVYQPEALHQMGWTDSPERPALPEMCRELFLGNRCGLAFPLTSVGLGIALALMTNRLRDSKSWPQFIASQSTIAGIGQLFRILGGVIKVTFSYAWPIPIFVTGFAAIALYLMTTGSEPSPWKPAEIANTLVGGMDEEKPGNLSEEEAEAFLERQKERRREWKTSISGRMLGLFGDSIAKIVGGYFSIVGMGLGIVVIQYGLHVAPQQIRTKTDASQDDID